MRLPRTILLSESIELTIIITHLTSSHIFLLLLVRLGGYIVSVGRRTPRDGSGTGHVVPVYFCGNRKFVYHESIKRDLIQEEVNTRDVCKCDG